MWNRSFFLLILDCIVVLGILSADTTAAQKPLLVRTEPFANAVYLDILPFHRLVTSSSESLNKMRTGPLWIEIDNTLSIEIELDTLNSWSRRILDWGESRTQGFSDAIRKQISQTLLRQFGINADKWHKKRTVVSVSKQEQDPNEGNLTGTQAGHVLSDHELLKLGYTRARLLHNPTTVPVMGLANLTLRDQATLFRQCDAVSPISSAILLIHKQSRQLRDLRLAEKHSYGSDTSKDRAARRAIVSWLSMFDPVESKHFKGYYNAWSAVNSISAWSETSMCIVDLTSDQIFHQVMQTQASRRKFDDVPEDVEVSVFYRLDKDSSYWKDRRADSYAVRRGLPYLLPILSETGMLMLQNAVAESPHADAKLAVLPTHGLVLEFAGSSTFKDMSLQQRQQQQQQSSKALQAWLEKEAPSRGSSFLSSVGTNSVHHRKTWHIAMDDYRPKETLIKRDNPESTTLNGTTIASSHEQIISFGTNLLNRDAMWLSYYRGNHKVKLYVSNHSSIYNITGATAFLICLAFALFMGAFFSSHFTQGKYRKCYLNTSAAVILTEVPKKASQSSASDISYSEQIRLSSKAALFSFGLWLICIVTMITLATDVTIYGNNGATDPPAIVNYVLGSVWLIFQLFSIVSQIYAKTLKTNLLLASIQLFANGTTFIFILGNLLLYDVSRPFNLGLFAVAAFGLVLYLWDVLLDTMIATLFYQMRYHNDPVIPAIVMILQLASIVLYATFFYDFAIRPAALTFAAMFYTGTSIEFAVWSIWFGLGGVMIIQRLNRV